MTSIGFPALGTGVGGFPFKRGADVMVRALARCLEAETTVDRVTLALHARAGVTDADLNAFYEHALGLASLASQSGRLEGRIDALQGSLHRVASGRAAELDQIGTELHDARMNLLITPDAIEDIDRRAEDSGVVELGERAIEVAQETVGNAGVGDVPTILAALDTELEAWRTKCNAYVLLMMKLQNERATYDTANVPTSLESRIERLAETIRQSYAVVDDVKQRLAGYQRAASAP